MRYPRNLLQLAFVRVAEIDLDTQSVVEMADNQTILHSPSSSVDKPQQ